jgi:predicted ATPase/class 3 adenylate cyclase
VAVGAPTGTVTFLFTDIEGSTRLWESAPEAMQLALARHDELVRAAMEAHGGYVFATGGDGFAAAFARAGDAMGAAVASQTRLAAETWPEGAPIRVRMGLHTGEVEERGGDYFGPAVNRAARIMAAGHGGQVLVSATTSSLLGPQGLSDLGEHSLAGLDDVERVYQVGSDTFGPLRSLGATPSNLPSERSVFVGRERELAVVAGLVRSARLVTLTGVGGVGKTRLAIRAAGGLAGEFPGGVWLVELAPLSDPALVAAAVASALGLSVAGGLDATEALCAFLAQRRALVVLDNCEHVIEAAATLVDRLLATAPRARVLATSREALDLEGESAWRVPSLSIDSDALALFTERASEALPGFSLADSSVHDAALAVCRRLDGIPLAIELAAARARVLSVDQIAAHLDERFRLLTRGGRTTGARHQTLQGAIDWSYGLLGAEERAVFDSLGVFAGEFDLSSVAAVAGLDDFEALDVIEQLVAKSMVEADPWRNRYRLLETLRQYAWDRLVASERLIEARDAHAVHYSALATEQARRMGEGGRQLDALDRLEADYDNLRAALAWLIEEGRADDASRLVRRLSGLFNIRHPREGYSWFKQVVRISDDLPVQARARLLADTGWAAMNAGDPEGETSYALASVSVSAEEAPAVTYWLLGNVASAADDLPAAAEHYREAIVRAAATRDLSTEVTATALLVTTLAELGDASGLRKLIPEAIAVGERLGNPTILAVAYQCAAIALERIGSAPEAVDMFERGLTHGTNGGPIAACAYRCAYTLAVDDPLVAAGILRPAVLIAKEHLSGFHQAPPLLSAAKISLALGHEGTAARLFGAFVHFRKGSSFMRGTTTHQKRLLRQLTDRLGSTAANKEIARGAALSIAQALQLAEDVAGTGAEGANPGSP